MLSLKTEKPVMFIDGSYYIFYRFFATNFWFKKQDQARDASDITKNSVFMDKYKKIFEKTLEDLVKSHNVPWEHVIFVKDCSRENIWRHAHYDSYKSTRDANLSSEFDGEIFNYTYSSLLPSLTKKYGFKLLDHPNLEADDVIAIVHQAMRQKTKDNNIYIITNDNDYIQLSEANTYIYNLQGKLIADRVKQEPALYLEYKIILGDKSDNIPSIMKKVGPKTAEKLAKDPQAMQEFFNKNPDALKQYTINRTLIDFNYIDKSLKKSLLESIDIK
jgi:5'-3' exonuclease